MTATRFIPVHLPELADCEAPAPDHEGRPQHVPIYNPTGVTLALQQLLHRGELRAGDYPAIYAAIQLIDAAAKRGVL